MSKKTLLKQQLAYKNKGQTLADFKRLMDAEAREAAKRIKERFPKFKDFDAQSNIRVYPRTPIGQGKTKPIIEIVQLILDDLSASKKQIEILREVQAKFPQTKLLPNLWNKELHPAVLKKVKAKIDGNMAEPVSMRGLKKLSEVRKEIYAQRKVKEAVKILKKRISLSKAEVIVGKAVYPVQMRNKGKPTQRRAVRVTVKGKREWINFLPLCALLLEVG